MTTKHPLETEEKTLYSEADYKKAGRIAIVRELFSVWPMVLGVFVMGLSFGFIAIDSNDPGWLIFSFPLLLLSGIFAIAVLNRWPYRRGSRPE